MFRPILTLSAVLSMAAPALAAQQNAAQAQPTGTQITAPGGERVNMVIIFGDDACPQGKGDEITVCARKAESERYRIPEPFRENTGGPKNESWNNKVIAYERVGASGAQSCSPVGAGGQTGCVSQFIKNAYAERKQSSDVQFSKMIEAEREKRLGKIDDEAARTQSDVEDEEKAYFARKQKQAEAEAKAKAEAAQHGPPAPGQ
ncbi:MULTISPECIES: hypothetical protein [unclassified Novosphingobium]|uniref:hypothetical protein n=1 Tax=unclassified Novosphingobium TaxID=2644732 RepID=UPI000869667E|nr:MULTISPECIES: hypothetical protein [unclassified Novosphingobium]MBN9142713.1 hypothetical protein [Novosphingobium sp.]MDR6705797.1 hypothetical protein [Novosphingobium sp. 1748]NKJ00113.1 hypothetical protein [Novosphingobium sp. SG707]ODU85111.1 MAG: hypothetical protein ABT10_02410 [Novosphingobium sp. SCN 63-17]OJX89112.1 MAG: hypothetical protein BGP00_12670 [Novosphingobium sp. 63-713]